MPVSFQAKLADVEGPKQIKKWIAEDMRKRALKPELKRDAEKTVKGWQGEKPTFSLLIRESPKNMIYFTLYMRGSAKAKNKWNWLDLGTPAHPITAKKAPYLVFQIGYIAGSAPYNQGSQRLITRSAKRFGPYRKKISVEHPGIKARNWRKILADKHQKKFEKDFISAVNNAIRRSGHARRK